MIKNNYSKIHISKEINRKMGFSVLYSKKIVNDFITSCLNIIKDEIIILKNIGSLKSIDKNERIGRNPKSKEEFIINKRKSISFTPSKKLLKILNNNV